MYLLCFILLIIRNNNFIRHRNLQNIASKTLEAGVVLPPMKRERGKVKMKVEERAHHGEVRYFLFFDFHSDVQRVLQESGGARYSYTVKAWHMAADRQKLKEIYLKLKDKAEFDWGNLKKEEKKDGQLPSPAPKVTATETKTIPRPDLRHKMEAFKRWMMQRRYSENTVKTYTEALMVFLSYFSHKAPEAINNEDVVAFNNDYILARNLSSSFQNQIINAVKLYYRCMEQRVMDLELIYRPRREKVLPNVLSKEEVKGILGALNNIKHRAMLSLIYSCGLRCGELLYLQLSDIDSRRGLIVIRQAKGKKDRIVPLSEKILPLLRDYYLVHKPVRYVFEGQEKGRPYDERSLQQVLKQAVLKARIQKPVTLHWLRHSYATHLLENGTDLRYIQEILGHKSSKTTEIYTHVSNKMIQRIVSPFDYL
jgi:integrase/recombinase XerD